MYDACRNKYISERERERERARGGCMGVLKFLFACLGCFVWVLSCVGKGGIHKLGPMARCS